MAVRPTSHVLAAVERLIEESRFRLSLTNDLLDDRAGERLCSSTARQSVPSVPPLSSGVPLPRRRRPADG